MSAYTVREDAGLVDDLLFVIKEDGRASEQTLRVLVEASVPAQGRAIRGISVCVYSTVLLEHFAGEKPLRMSQISRKVDPLRSNYCVYAVCAQYTTHYTIGPN